MSTPAFRVALLGMASVVVYDALASLASLGIGFSYAYSAFGSLVLYCAFGYWASRVRSILFAATVGALMGLADATLGWAVSWVLGPGRWEVGTLSVPAWALVALQVGAVATLAALVGGVVGRHVLRGQRHEA
jgi:hypothetical protein